MSTLIFFTYSAENPIVDYIIYLFYNHQRASSRSTNAG